MKTIALVTCRDRLFYMIDQQNLEQVWAAVKLLKPTATLEQVKAAIGDAKVDPADDEKIVDIVDRIIEVIELENGNIKLEWYDGTMVEFRDMTVQDSIDLDQFRLDNAGPNGSISAVSSALKMLDLLCVRWGAESKAPISEIRKLPAKDLRKVMVRVAALTEFFRLGD
jgi:hypothetical protein